MATLSQYANAFRLAESIKSNRLKAGSAQINLLSRQGFLDDFQEPEGSPDIPGTTSIEGDVKDEDGNIITKADKYNIFYINDTNFNRLLEKDENGRFIYESEILGTLNLSETARSFTDINTNKTVRGDIVGILEDDEGQISVQVKHDQGVFAKTLGFSNDPRDQVMFNNREQLKKVLNTTLVGMSSLLDAEGKGFGSGTVATGMQQGVRARIGIKKLAESGEGTLYDVINANEEGVIDGEITPRNAFYEGLNLIADDLNDALQADQQKKLDQAAAEADQKVKAIRARPEDQPGAVSPGSETIAGISDPSKLPEDVKEFIANANPQTIYSRGEIETLSQGLSKGFRNSFQSGWLASQAQIRTKLRKIQQLENDGAPEEEITRQREQLDRLYASQQERLDKVRNNMVTDAETQERVRGVQADEINRRIIDLEQQRDLPGTSPDEVKRIQGEINKLLPEGEKPSIVDGDKVSEDPTIPLFPMGEGKETEQRNWLNTYSKKAVEEGYITQEKVDKVRAMFQKYDVGQDDSKDPMAGIQKLPLYDSDLDIGAFDVAASIASLVPSNERDATFKTIMNTLQTGSPSVDIEDAQKFNRDALNYDRDYFLQLDKAITDSINANQDLIRQDIEKIKVSYGKMIEEFGRRRDGILANIATGPLNPRTNSKVAAAIQTFLTDVNTLAGKGRNFLKYRDDGTIDPTSIENTQALNLIKDGVGAILFQHAITSGEKRFMDLFKSEAEVGILPRNLFDQKRVQKIMETVEINGEQVRQVKELRFLDVSGNITSTRMSGRDFRNLFGSEGQQLRGIVEQLLDEG